MRDSRDIHGFQETLRRAEDRIRSDETILMQNKLHLLKFHEHCFAEGLSRARIVKYLYTLLTIEKILGKDFSKCNRDDIVSLVGKIEQSTRWSEATKRDFKIALKKFYHWIRGVRKRGVYPEEVDWIITTEKNRNNNLPKTILSEDEVKRLAQVASNIRNKALVNTLYESGARIGEILNMRVRDINFEGELGAVIVVSGKTGDRRIRLVASAPSLAEWVSSHPERENSEAFVWPLGYRAVNKMLKSLTRKAKIRKHITPHIFRHSRATHLVKKLSDQHVKQLMGWTRGSNMTEVYIHLSGRDLDNALLEMNGLSTPKAVGSKFSVKVCLRCQEHNSPDATYCKRCTYPLDAEAMEWENKAMNELLSIPQVSRYMRRMLRQIGVKR